jgi:prepilin signal peptidase PulO-like enzyme (type II secretory pathway)
MDFYHFVIYLFLFLVGSSLGSFLNVLIFRIHNDEQWFTGRSHCNNCKKELSWKELVPVISFIIQKGKCLNCKTSISVIYPIVELLSGLLGIFVVWRFGFTFEALVLYFVAFLCLGSFVSDLLFMELPEIFSWSIFALGIIYQIFFSQTEVYLIIYGVIFGFLFFWLQYFFTKGNGLGEGDIRLGLIMGLYLAFPMVIFAIAASYLLATIILIPLFLIKKINRKSMIPLGVFLIPIFLIFLFYSNEIQIFLQKYYWL